VRICPEVEIGLGTPRESIRLVSDGEDVRLVGIRSGTDHTERMTAYAGAKADEIASLGLRGFVLKKAPLRAAWSRSACPSRPNDARERDTGSSRLRSSPGTRTFRWRKKAGFAIRASGRTSSRDLLLRPLAPARERSRGLGRSSPFTRLTTSSSRTTRRVRSSRKARGRAVLPAVELARRYETGLMTSLKRVASTDATAAVLEHLAGFLKEELGPADREELHRHVRDYQLGYVPSLRRSFSSGTI
jgi:hypothetical protein